MACVSHLCAVEYLAIWLVQMFNDGNDRGSVDAFLPNKSSSRGLASIFFAFVLRIYRAKKFLKGTKSLILVESKIRMNIVYITSHQKVLVSC